MVRRVGVVGYGSLGKFLCEKIRNDPSLELCFVWNRSKDKIEADIAADLLPKDCVLETLEDFSSRKPDLVVEVAHPKLSVELGPKVLEVCDFFLGSPTALADSACFHTLLALSKDPSKGNLYVPVGALWNAREVQRMANRGILTALHITMTKHPSSLKLESPLDEKLAMAFSDPDQAHVIYEGSVGALCPLAPNNVNTMASLAIAGHTLGFEKTTCTLVADSRLMEHIVEIRVEGPENEDLQNKFNVTTTCRNPAKPGAVTGQVTYFSFFSSLLNATARNPTGVQFC